MNKKIIYFILSLSFLFSQSRDYADFEIITYSNPYPANIFIHSIGIGDSQNKYMAILDSTLNTYWYVNGNEMGIDFKENNYYISYFNKDVLKWIIADSYMQEIDTLQCTQGITDYHDIRITNEGNYIIQSYDSLYVDMSQIVEGGDPNALVKNILRIQELTSDHEILLDWFALEYLDVASYTNLNLTNNQFSFMHGNSIDIDEDNNLILSNRRSSEIIKINRTTGDIIWIMGGPQNEFTFINDLLEGFSKQHDARRLDNGNILVFDNGNEHQPPKTRIAEYEVDEINKTAILVWEFANPDNHVALSMGSCQRLPNENTLINWGNINGIGSSIMEVDYNQNIVLEIQYNNYKTYKVRKSNWQFEIPMFIGDSNLDNNINVLDIIYQVNHVLNNDSPNKIFDLYKIDINKDSFIDILDIVELVNIIL